MKTISETYQAYLTKKVQVDPCIKLAIYWDSSDNPTYYATIPDIVAIGADSVLDGTTLQLAYGSIVDISPIETAAKSRNQATVSSVTLTLVDVNNEILEHIKSTDFIGATCEIYYDEASRVGDTDAIIFSGKLSSNFNWSEGTRQVTLTIESDLENLNCGFALEEGDMTYLPDELIGQPWPMCFGSVIRAPAFKITNVLRGSIQQPVTNTIVDADGTIRITNGRQFPQNETVNLSIDGIVFQGTFDGDEFTFSTGMVARYTTVALADRPDSSDDPDEEGKRYLWLADAEYDNGVRIVDMWCKIGSRVNYCIAQDGAKCLFKYKWDQLYDSEDTIDEISKWGLPTWTGFTYYDPLPGDLVYWNLSFQGKYSVPSGTTVYLADDERAIYIASQISASEVKEVLAYRNVNGKRILVAVPSDYYTIYIDYDTTAGSIGCYSDSDSESVPAVSGGPTSCTAIMFERPLLYYEGEGWEEDIFISLVSTEGPNVADIIQYLVEEYTEFSIDATSFAAVQTAVQYYPANFCINPQGNVISLIEEIAWQSRCAIIIDTEIVYLKYLSEEPDVDMLIDEGDIYNRVIEVSTVDANELTTRLTVTWRDDLSLGIQKKIIKENNISRYGTLSDSHDIYIYNIKELVDKTATFWLNRKSNLWKQVKFDARLSALVLQPFDCISLGLYQDLITSDDSELTSDEGSDNLYECRAIVQSVRTDVEGATVSITAWLPIKIGEATQSEDAWLVDDDDSSQDDPTASLSVISYTPEIVKSPYSSNIPRDTYGKEETGDLRSLYAARITAISDRTNGIISIKLLDDTSAVVGSQFNAFVWVDQSSGDLDDFSPDLQVGSYIYVFPDIDNNWYLIVPSLSSSIDVSSGALQGTVKLAQTQENGQSNGTVSCKLLDSGGSPVGSAFTVYAFPDMGSHDLADYIPPISQYQTVPIFQAQTGNWFFIWKFFAYEGCTP